jgi:hypothetical protein
VVGLVGSSGPVVAPLPLFLLPLGLPLGRLVGDSPEGAGSSGLPVGTDRFLELGLATSLLPFNLRPLIYLAWYASNETCIVIKDIRMLTQQIFRPAYVGDSAVVLVQALA